MPAELEGVVIRSTGSWYEVSLPDGRILPCRLKGKFRLAGLKTTNPVAVGDHVIVDDESDPVIIQIKERENYIIRQSPRKKNHTHILAANLDQAILLVTYALPRTSTGFMDRFLVTAEAYHIPTQIVFNKQDAFNEKQLAKQAEIIDIYRYVGYPVHVVSVMEGTGMEELEEAMKGKTSLLAGHSGVGKSSLLNHLVPELELSTREISRTHEKGKHTTTFAEMFDIPGGGRVIDTPGIKEFGVLDFEESELAGYFPEMKELRENCKFSNCLHLNEPKCAVHSAVEEGLIPYERFKNYVNIMGDVHEANNNWG